METHPRNDGSPTLLILAGYGPSLINFRGDLIRSVCERGWSVVACGPGLDDEALREQLGELGAIPRSIALGRSGLNPFADAMTCWGLWRLFRQVRPTCVLSYSVKPVVYGSLVARWCGVPRVTAMMTGLGTLFVRSHGPGRTIGPLFDRLLRHALDGCDAVILQNPDDREELIARGLIAPAVARVVAGSGVNLHRFPPRPVPGGRVTFLMIARLLEEKGVREFAEAAGQLRQRGYDCECHLVGPLERHPRAIPEKAVTDWQRRGWLTWHGGVEDVRPHLARCSVYVLPSYREGTPRSVLEALATGRPVITTDTPGCRRTVVDGENGHLVPARDVEALASAMIDCIEHPDRLDAMGQASLRLVREQFDVELVNREVRRILQVDSQTD